VQAVEVADVAVQCRDSDDRLRVQQTGSQHRPERIEVCVSVRGDDLLGAHGRIVAANGGQT
jgi:hypothetical protein